MEEKQTAPALTLEPELSVPSLTLEPEPAAPAQEQKKPAVEPEPMDAGLSPEEKKAVDEFAEKIDLRNSTVVLQYGAASQKKVADFSSSTLENIRTKDLGEVGGLLTSLVTELRSFGEEDSKGLKGLFKRGGNKVAAMKANAGRNSLFILHDFCQSALRGLLVE